MMSSSRCENNLFLAQIFAPRGRLQCQDVTWRATVRDAFPRAEKCLFPPAGTPESAVRVGRRKRCFEVYDSAKAVNQSKPLCKGTSRSCAQLDHLVLTVADAAGIGNFLGNGLSDVVWHNLS